MAKRRVERTRMNLVPGGTAIASTCQHRIPRLIVLEQIVGSLGQLVEVTETGRFDTVSVFSLPAGLIVC